MNKKWSEMNHVLMMLTAKNNLPAESPSGAELATLLISVFFLIFMKDQRKTFDVSWVVVSATPLTTPPGGCSLKRVGRSRRRLFLLLLFLLAALHSVRLSSKPDMSALKQVLALPWRPSPCGPCVELLHTRRDENRRRRAAPLDPAHLSARSNKRATPRSRCRYADANRRCDLSPPPPRSRIQVRAAGREAAV